MLLRILPFLCFTICPLFLACDAPSRKTEFGDSNTVSLYLEALRPVLQELRTLDREIESTVSADTVASDLIVPLIQRQFRTKLVQLQVRVQQLPTTPALISTNLRLLSYLKLRIRAYDLALEGARDNRPELFNAFDQKQAQADSAARVFEISLRKVQESFR